MWFLSWCTAGVEEDISQNEPVIQVVDAGAPSVYILSQLWRPFVSQDKINLHGITAISLFKETTLGNVDIEDLMATAKRISKVEASPQGYFEIGSIFLGKNAVEALQKQFKLANLFPDQEVEVKVRKLLIITLGNADQHSLHQMVPEQEKRGTVEVILNSEFNGGELQVACDGQVTIIRTRPYDWVAVKAAASCAIRPITSGVRVSLIYDVRVVAVSRTDEPVPMLAEGRFLPTSTYYGSDICGLCNNLPQLIGIAEQLKPELVGKRNLTIEACMFNTNNLQLLGSGVNLSRLFGKKKVTVEARCVVIQRSEGEKNPIVVDGGVREGYLGTLVIVLDRASSCDTLCLRRGVQSATVRIYERDQWYAYTADTIADSVPVSSGAHVTVNYSIYAANDPPPVHYPLPEIPSILTRSVASNALREQVLGAFETELADTDAVIVSLQHLLWQCYYDNLCSTFPLHLQGGDSVLYNILTGASSTELYHVELVWASLPFRYDADLKRDVLVPEKIFFASVSDPQKTQKQCKRSGPMATKVVLSTKLTERHRALNYADSKKVYRVYCLYVSKKMK